MLAAVHFDDQFPARSAEIGNLRPDRVLSAEVDAVFPQQA
jgi:hypothetical protein